MKKNNNLRVWSKYLRPITFSNFVMSLLNIPLGLWSADKMASVVMSATDGKTELVLRHGAELLIVTILFKIFRSLYNIKFSRMNSNIVQQCKLELYNRFLSSPLSKLYTSDSGQTKEKLSDDFNTVLNKNTSVYPGFFVNIITIVVYFIFIARLHFLTALFLTLIAVLQVISPVIIKKYLEVNYDNTREIEGKLSDFIIEAHHGFATIKLYKLKNWYTEKLFQLHKKYLKIGNAGIFATTAENTINSFISVILKYGSCAVAGLFVLSNKITIDAGIKILALSGSFLGAWGSAFSAITRFAVIKRAESRLSEWFDDRDDGLELNNGEVNFSDVCLKFEDRAIFDNFELHFKSGLIYIIKGENGAGKSTVFKLITGLINADSGQIEVGGVNPARFSENTFLNKLLYIPQEDPEFPFTPNELYNMLFGDDISDVTEIAYSLGLTQKQLNETNINELSGGERKKVFLSLSFAVNPEILLLDEPTNSLDQDGKNILLDKIKSRKGSTFIITHDTCFDLISNNILYIDRSAKYEKELLC